MEQLHQARRASDSALPDGPTGIKRFEQPEAVMALDRGRLEVLTVGGKTVGMGSYAPGWKWSRCSGPPLEADGAVESVAVVLSGRVRTRVHEGREVELRPGDFFHFVLTAEYDAWVIGNRPCEVLYLSGVEAMIRMLEGSGNRLIRGLEAEQS